MRSVLHVLPHSGAGGETYIDALTAMDAYTFERIYLAPSANAAGSRRAIVHQVLRANRAALSYDVIHVVGEVASLLCLPALATRPSVVSPQGLHLLRRVSGAGRGATKSSLRTIVRAASRTVCSSNDEYTEVLGVVGRRSARRVILVRNGVEVGEPVAPDEKAAARAEFGLGPREVAGAWLASLHEHKDPETPIRAAKEVRRSGIPLVLLVAGDGPLRQRVEDLAAGKGTDPAVRILGFRTDVRCILAAADFFVLSSLREGLSFSLLEAMALGLPAVVSDAPANAEAVGDSGIVVPYGDTGRFADAFGGIVKDERERLALGERARERVVRHFRVEDMVRRTREIYDSALEERSRC